MFGCGVGNSSKDASRKLTEEEVRKYQTDASRQNSKKYLERFEQNTACFVASVRERPISPSEIW